MSDSGYLVHVTAHAAQRLGERIKPMAGLNKRERLGVLATACRLTSHHWMPHTNARFIKVSNMFGEGQDWFILVKKHEHEFVSFLHRNIYTRWCAVTVYTEDMFTEFRRLVKRKKKVKKNWLDALRNGSRDTNKCDVWGW